MPGFSGDKSSHIAFPGLFLSSITPHNSTVTSRSAAPSERRPAGLVAVWAPTSLRRPQWATWEAARRVLLLVGAGLPHHAGPPALDQRHKDAALHHGHAGTLDAGGLLLLPLVHCCLLFLLHPCLLVLVLRYFFFFLHLLVYVLSCFPLMVLDGVESHIDKTVLPHSPTHKPNMTSPSPGPWDRGLHGPARGHGGPLSHTLRTCRPVASGGDGAEGGQPCVLHAPVHHEPPRHHSSDRCGVMGGSGSGHSLVGLRLTMQLCDWWGLKFSRAVSGWPTHSRGLFFYVRAIVVYYFFGVIKIVWRCPNELMPSVWQHWIFHWSVLVENGYGNIPA